MNEEVINLPKIEDSSEVQVSPLTAWLVWGASAVFVLFQFFLQLSSGVMVEDLMHSFAINALGAGILSSTYYYIYVALQTPAGILVDLYGPRRLLTLGAFACAIGCGLFAISSHLLIAEIGRLLMGAGSSFAFVGSLYLISQWFPAEKFALMVGIAETVGTIGTLIGNIFLAALLTHYGWRSSMAGATVLALLIGLVCWLIIRDRPLNVQNRAKIKTDTHFFHHAWALIKNPKAWINGLYSGLMFSVVTVFVALWGIPFMIKAYHISITMAAIMSSFVFLGLAIGCPVIGILCHRIKKLDLLLGGSALATAVLLAIVLWMTQLPLFVLAVLLFLIGCLCSSYVINFAIAKEIAPKEATSTSIGFTNTLSVITAPLMQPLVGGLLHWVHEQSKFSSLAGYTLLDYQIALMVLPMGLVVAAFMGVLIKK